MAKEYKRGNKEAKKPKQMKTVPPVAPLPGFGRSLDTATSPAGKKKR